MLLHSLLLMETYLTFLEHVIIYLFFVHQGKITKELVGWGKATLNPHLRENKHTHIRLPAEGGNPPQSNPLHPFPEDAQRPSLFFFSLPRRTLCIFFISLTIVPFSLFPSFSLALLHKQKHGPSFLKQPPSGSGNVPRSTPTHQLNLGLSPSDRPPNNCEKKAAGQKSPSILTMNHMGSPPFAPADHPSTKRKRSLSGDEPHRQPTPPAKVPKTNANHLQINYLARQYQEILPLISPDDALPSLLSLISDYDGVLHRHESMAGNLGARPLGPILIQRFERLFDGPPRVLKTHGKEGTSVGWLDVVDFARNKPEQFNLEKMREGNRVCQFYTKQCRVEISEEDYLLVKSGMPERLIPPQPIVEDEEKELGTLEILEKNLSGVVQLADQGEACLTVLRRF